MQILASYLQDTWRTGDGQGAPLRDPVTGAVVASASTASLDLAAALQHGRAVGGPALQALTFAQRGALLAALSKAIHAQRDALIEIGRINAGNTRADAKFDIDGATGTLMYYAGLGAQLGDRRILQDGEAAQLTRNNRLQGQHIWVPRPGVAVLINAFNFPAWGLAEKLAQALLAGMPVIGKPATATAWMTEAMVRAMVEADVLPPGAVSLLTGSAGDLLDHLGWGDVVAFTGGAETALRIRGHRKLLEAGVPVNVEADSLNATLLLPGAEEATYDAFLRSAHTEITQKAGQKCTATRRILVPADQLEAVIEDLGALLSRTRVGDPADPDVRMGPLATAEQLTSAREGLAALQTQADVVWGDVDGGAAINGGRGCFMTPLLLQARETTAPGPVHDREVFGPVSTLLPYTDLDEALTAIRLGQGSLVSSIYGDDRDALSAAVLGLAGWHGRLVVTDARIADKALAPGLVMPHLLHGGPGRAGGGQELGGLSGLNLYTQRCAVQGNAALLERLTGAAG